ncbi:CLUMA_CG014243, isoform B [Clunio marinus]|uniref:non-specific serine/threonine protein kinase n=1 Tax=Clunio marinus TaxID=568069 RepID=A0A1J1IL01_9DIPT|nr:CLUMA_CG014243, isoform B [Clunio marinus]
MNTDKEKKVKIKKNRAKKFAPLPSEISSQDRDKFDELPEQKKKNKITQLNQYQQNFDDSSILNHTNIQSILKQKMKTRKNMKLKGNNSSYDEFYDAYLEEKKEKLKIYRNQKKSFLKHFQNIKVSTPRGKAQKNKTDLEFGVSPIQQNEEDNDLSKGCLDSFRRQKLSDMEKLERELETSALRSAKALLAKCKENKNTLKSSQNIGKLVHLNVPSRTTTDQKIRHTKSPKYLKKKNTKRTPTVVNLNILKARKKLHETQKNESSFKDLNSKADNHSFHFSSFQHDISNEAQNLTKNVLKEQDLTLHHDLKVFKEDLNVTGDNKSTNFVDNNLSKHVNLTTHKKPSEKKTYDASTLKRKTTETPCETQYEIDSTKHPTQNYQHEVIVDKSESLQFKGNIMTRNRSKKSVTMNLVPLIRKLSAEGIEGEQSGKTLIEAKFSKKSVGSSVLPLLNDREKINLKPGKWRRSLISYRKSCPQKNRTNRSIIYEETALLEQSDEGTLHAALSILDSSIKCATTFQDQRKTSQRQTSVFERSSIFYGLQEPVIDDDSSTPILSACQIVLRRCGQQEPLPFNEVYSESLLPNCCKIGEGVYGEVFMYKCPKTHQPIVLKIIPIEGNQLVNGEPQKRYDEILQEIIISMELSGMRNNKDYATNGFVNVQRVLCVKGAYPLHLVDEWELYRDNRPEGSDNDHPEIFDHNQIYIVFELCNGGKDLEAFVFNNAAEAQSVFLQTALTLAVAERKFEFEHRDLHWGNILIAPTTNKSVEFRFDSKVVKLPTNGVKVTIIDYSLSRMVYDGAVLYDNLARDEELFQSTGDYQFDIYRLMRDRVENNFERYEPFTNLLWLHYIVDKLINGARYRYSKTKKHRSAVNELMQERDELLNFLSASDYVDSLEI